MKRILGLFALLMLSTLPALAQSEGYPKFEAGGGFLYRDYGAQFQENTNEIGWFATADYNFRNWLGFDADFDGGYAHPFHADTHQYTVMFGPQVYPLGHHRLTPFAHALFGVSHFNFPDFDFSDTAFGFALGAGADWKLTHHIALRVGEIDFEQFRNFGGGTTGNPLQNGFKAKVGVIFSF
ncbi:MAG TPA: outer membrane beta-barrel protein [Candidatus Acidoferrum sp.]|nr:outer membrane beta-barrel protein [Candidatus Acidoferrum sp.]